MDEFGKGALSGMVGVTISHPFDTIKTCIQDKKPVTLHPRALYRGFTAPLFGVGFEKAIVFGVFTNTQNYLRSNSFSDVFTIPVAGALSGLTASFIVTPVERVKILLQTGKKVNYRTISPKYLFTGLSATFTRETPGFAIYFSTYESLKRRFYTNEGRDITKTGSFLFGGLAGGFSWVFIFPQDCIKTQMQANVSTQKSFTMVFKSIYSEYGFRGFYRGFSFALMRAVPLHAGTFMTMELLNSSFKKI